MSNSVYFKLKVALNFAKYNGRDIDACSVQTVLETTPEKWEKIHQAFETDSREALRNLIPGLERSSGMIELSEFEDGENILVVETSIPESDLPGKIMEAFELLAKGSLPIPQVQFLHMIAIIIMRDFVYKGRNYQNFVVKFSFKAYQSQLNLLMSRWEDKEISVNSLIPGLNECEEMKLHLIFGSPFELVAQPQDELSSNVIKGIKKLMDDDPFV